MIRGILGVFLGYLATAVSIMLAFSGLFMLLGVDRTFQPGTFVATTLWNTLALGIATLAAMLGGVVCVLVARRAAPAFALAILFLVLGGFSAATTLRRPDPGPRTGPVSNFEAATKTRQPVWYAFTIPLLGAAGVVAGGQLILAARRPRAATPSPGAGGPIA